MRSVTDKPISHNHYALGYKIRPHLSVYLKSLTLFKQQPTTDQNNSPVQVDATPSSRTHVLSDTEGCPVPSAFNDPLAITTVELCIQRLMEIPDLPSDLFYIACIKLEDPTRRRIFLVMDSRFRRGYIENMWNGAIDQHPNESVDDIDDDVPNDVCADENPTIDTTRLILHHQFQATHFLQEASPVYSPTYYEYLSVSED
ncbi:hypothetical protein DH2020_019208 [Rehmannia glutinosa]|uniref:Uncharacterized protein n=1 Tax=Rehmannia glutinosa TaxID=99300 RepID=A0ABR0WL60_REHGL